MNIEDVIVNWTIGTFDHRLKEPLPLPQRHYVLDWAITTNEEKEEILQILNIPKTSNKHKSDGTGLQKTTISIGRGTPDERMLKFRHLFIEKPLNHLHPKNIKFFCSVNLNREYFEDEAGREISMQEIFQIIHGENVLLFEAASIARIDPSTLRASDKWTVEKANTLFNFIQVITLISNSGWAQKKTSVTTLFRGTKSEKCTCDFPVVESICSVLTLFRQLYAEHDLLMKKTCEIYNEHSSNPIKIQWVNFCLKQFEESLDSNSHLFQLKNCTARELLQMFLYATGVVHSISNENLKKRERFSAIVGQYGREIVIMAISESLWNIFGYATKIFHVIKKDFEYWTGHEGCANSDMFNIYSLF